VVQLKSLGGRRSEPGTRIGIDFEKARHFSGPDRRSVIASLKATGTTSLIWEREQTLDEQREMAIMLQAKGMPQKEIAKSLGISAGKVNGLLRRPALGAASWGVQRSPSKRGER